MKAGMGRDWQTVAVRDAGEPAMRSTERRVGQEDGSASDQAAWGCSLAKWASSSSSSAMPVK